MDQSIIDSNQLFYYDQDIAGKQKADLIQNDITPFDDIYAIGPNTLHIAG